jgi:hypothetical protein
MLQFGPYSSRLKPPSAASADTFSFILGFVKPQRSCYCKLMRLLSFLSVSSTVHYLCFTLPETVASKAVCPRDTLDRYLSHGDNLTDTCTKSKCCTLKPLICICIFTFKGCSWRTSVLSLSSLNALQSWKGLPTPRKSHRSIQSSSKSYLSTCLVLEQQSNLIYS